MRKKTKNLKSPNLSFFRQEAHQQMR